MHSPPSAAVCSPARLFRVLTSGQPRWPLSYQPPGLERFTLEARGLSACEAGDLFDELDRLESGKRSTVLTLDVIALSLLADGRRAFSTRAEVGALPEPVIDQLGRACFDALKVCGPLYRSTDDAAWTRVLQAGARENPWVASALGACIDDGASFTTYRPDRYWGKPIVDVTDGQWMAYRAARWFLKLITPPPKQVRTR